MIRQRASIDDAEHAAFHAAWRTTSILGLIPAVAMLLIYGNLRFALIAGLTIGLVAGAIGMLLGFVYAHQGSPPVAPGQHEPPRV